MQEKSSLKFSERLTLALKQAGMRPSQLAALSSVSKGYVSGLLSGTKSSPSIETCRKFSEVLGVSFVWLFDGDLTNGAPEHAKSQNPVEVPVKDSDSATSAQHFAAGVQSMLTEMAEMRRRLQDLENIVKNGHPP